VSGFVPAGSQPPGNRALHAPLPHGRFPKAIGFACVALIGILVFLPTTAFGAEGNEAPSEALFLLQVTLLVLLGRILGEGMQRIGQPAVIGQLIAGIMLGPSVLGLLWPSAQQQLFPANLAQKSMIDGLSQFGILMLLLLAGMETDLDLVRKVRRAALSVSVAGIAVPFVGGLIVGELLPDAMLPRPDKRFVVSLFLGTALAISSVKIVAMVVREMNFLRRNVGQVILASAIIDDTIGWIIVAVTFSLATSGAVDLVSVAKSIGGTALFLAFSFTIGRPVVFAVIRWTNDHFAGELPVTSAILVLMTGMALITHVIGVHTVLGAFVAGILIGESPILTREIEDQVRGLTIALFAPVFFGLSGLNSDLTILSNPALVLTTLGLIVIASLGKFGGAYAGGWVGGLDRAERLALACGMNARGSTEIIVASIGLSTGLLSHDLFTMIVAMAVVTTMAMPPTLRWALHRMPLRDDEQQRLDRAEFETRAFVPNLERLLVAIDGSANGAMAIRVAGLIAGPRGIPLTVLDINKKRAAAAVEPRVALDQAASEFLRRSRAAAPGGEQEEPREIDASITSHDASPRDAVMKEASKGFDLLIVGLDPTVAPTGGFSKKVTEVALAFEGPIAVVSARGEHERDPIKSAFNILVSTTGAEVARRGIDVALALGQATKEPVTVLYVTDAATTNARRRVSTPGQDERAVLGDARESAKHYGVAVETKIRADVAAEDAIMRELRMGRHNLVVMGLSRRPGKKLSFGHVAQAILESSSRSVIFVAS
jgi:Kef-type K+ transport system membrane component KefB/nucleotide-binding universal stress UspA family protein